MILQLEFVLLKSSIRVFKLELELLWLYVSIPETTWYEGVQLFAKSPNTTISTEIEPLITLNDGVSNSVGKLTFGARVVSTLRLFCGKVPINASMTNPEAMTEKIQVKIPPYYWFSKWSFKLHNM